MIDWNKPVQTRDGQAVEIITTKGRGEYSVIGYIEGDDTLYTWKIDGTYYGDDETSQWDISNVPEKKVMYINVYGDGSSYACCSPIVADTQACHSRRCWRSCRLSRGSV